MPLASPTQIEKNIQREIARISAYSEGEVGVAASHMQSGLTLLVNAEKRFPPGSCVKLPLAMAVLERVDKGELALDQMVEVQHVEMNSGGPLGMEFLHPGVSLSLMNLLEPMITRSCNTATDVLFRLVGGPGGAENYMRRMGIQNFDLQNTMRVALCVMHEIPLPPPDVSVRDVMLTASAHTLDARNWTNTRFHHEVRDHATPQAMLDLMRGLWDARMLSPRSRDLLLDVMGRTSTSVNRIQARLPHGLPFASKGGSGSGTAVDVGYLTLPDNQGTLALGIFLKGSPLNMDARNRTVAEIARLVYDYFMIVGE